MGHTMQTTGRSGHRHLFLPDPSALSTTATRTGKGKPWHLIRTMKPSGDVFPSRHYLYPRVRPSIRPQPSIMTYVYALRHYLRLITFFSNKPLTTPEPSQPPVSSKRTYQVFNGIWIHMAKGPFCNSRPEFGLCLFGLFLDTHSRLLRDAS